MIKYVIPIDQLYHEDIDLLYGLNYLEFNEESTQLNETLDLFERIK